MSSAIQDAYDNSVFWQMTPQERICFLSVLDSLNPWEVAVEVGTYCGGSLRHLADRFDNVYSLDIDHGRCKNYKNVENVTGKSAETFPKVLEKVKDSGKKISFFLIDGDHEYPAVVSDLSHCLSYKPESPCTILMHDSWYLPTRNAIKDCFPAMQENPYVQFIDLDFCNGNVVRKNQYMGGLCLIELHPLERKGPLVLLQSGLATFEDAYA